jgi:hypothetical protein
VRGQRHYVPEWKRAEFKEIAAAARAGFKRHRDRLLNLIRHLDALIEGGADMPRLDVNVLHQQREELQGSADRITAQLRSRSWFYFGLLEAAVQAGTDLGYTTPDQGKPFGPGIEHLVAAAARHGYQIGPDRACSLIKQFNALPRVRATFRGEGRLSADIDVVRSTPLWFWTVYAV